VTDPSDEDPTLCCKIPDKPNYYDNVNCDCDSLYADSDNEYW